MKKTVICLLLFCSLVLSVKASSVPQTDKKLIPDAVTKIWFEYKHYDANIKQEEYFAYYYQNDAIMGKFKFTIKDEKFERTIKGNSPLDSLLSEDNLIKLLNHIDFMNLPALFQNGNEKIRTVTLFNLKYIYKGKTYYKNVKVININSLFDNSTDSNVFNLKFLMVYIEGLENRVFNICSATNTLKKKGF